MTPNTQSFCKHCQQEIVPCDSPTKCSCKGYYHRSGAEPRVLLACDKCGTQMTVREEWGGKGGSYSMACPTCVPEPVSAEPTAELNAGPYPGLSNLPPEQMTAHSCGTFPDYKPCSECAPQPVDGEGPQEFDIRDGKHRYSPCARCGAKLGMGLSSDASGVFVRCTICSFVGPNGKNDKEAFELWNSLPAERGTPKLEEIALKAALEIYDGLGAITDEVFRQAWAKVRAQIIFKHVRPFITPACSPVNLWPTCDWCKSQLEKFAKTAGICPKCGALKLATPASTGEANGSNYVADDEVYPTCVEFANGRVVSVDADNGRVFLRIGMKSAEDTWIEHKAKQEDGADVRAGGKDEQ